MAFPLSTPTSMLKRIVEKEGTSLYYQYKDQGTGPHGKYLETYGPGGHGQFTDAHSKEGESGMLRGGKPFEFQVEQTPLFLKETFAKHMCDETKYAEAMYASHCHLSIMNGLATHLSVLAGGVPV